MYLGGEKRVIKNPLLALRCYSKAVRGISSCGHNSCGTDPLQLLGADGIIINPSKKQCCGPYEVFSFAGDHLLRDKY